MTKAPVFLIVLDGAGWGLEGENNAIRQSDLFNLQKWFIGQFQTWLLEASSDPVGLPADQVGGSEIGHTVIGAGSANPKYASVSAYSNAIRDPAYYESDQWKDIIQRLKETGGTAHLQTILSDGGIHSLQDNLYPQIEALAKAGIPVELHLALDGRDTPQGSALTYLERVQNKIKDIQKQYPNAVITIATLGGRAFAHDRDNKLENTQAAVSAMINPANSGFTDPKAYLEAYFNNNPSEETLPPIARNGFSGYDPKKDSMVFCNFRPDRMLQLVQTFLDMTGADPQTLLTAVKYTEDNFGVPFVVEVPPVLVSLPRLMDWVARAQGQEICSLAHSEKFAHVGNPFLNGVRRLFPSQRAEVFTSPDGQGNYAQHPEMRAESVTDAAILAANKGVMFVAVNYANPDMVGHTGNCEATIQACDHVATQLERLIREVQKDHPDAIFAIMADHGNADDMTTGAHSGNPVLFALVDGVLVDSSSPPRNDVDSIAQRYDAVVSSGLMNPDFVGNLADVAPTLLAAAGLPIPRCVEDLDAYKTLVEKIIHERKEAVFKQREVIERIPSFSSNFYDPDHLGKEAEKTLEQLDNLRTTLINEISDVQQQLRDRGDKTLMTGSDMRLPLNDRHPLEERRRYRFQEKPESEYLAWARAVISEVCQAPRG
jgi:2,3-bisphosphoglycerate-independent phosphoglycerate mutase